LPVAWLPGTLAAATRETVKRPAGRATSTRARERYPTYENFLPELFEGRRAEDEGSEPDVPAALEYTLTRVKELGPPDGLA
jgi:hypothetical protein